MNLERYISISDATENDVYSILQEVTNLYADNGTETTREVIVFKNKKISGEYIINFSETEDFILFNYYVNYIYYPKNHDSDIGNKVFGYWTVSENDDTNKALYGKRLQVYISENDDEGDNVYVIAQDGTETIKLGFAIGHEYEPLGTKEFNFFEKEQIPSDFYPPHIIRGIKEEKSSKKLGCSLILIFFLCAGILSSIIGCKEKTEIPSSPTPIKVEKNIKKELEIPYYQKDSIVYNWHSSLKDFSKTYKGFTTKTMVSKNDHDDRVNDTIKTLQFKKSKIITVATGDYFYGIWSANIQDRDLVFDNSIVIGMNKTQLENCIKTSIEHDIIRIGNLEQTSIFEFQFSNNILKRILFEGYVD